MKSLLKKLLQKYREYKFHKLNKHSSITISKPIQINWLKVNLSKNSHFKIDDHCILRGNLHCQKDGASLTIGKFTFVGVGTNIVSSYNVVVGDNVLISHNCYITDTNGHSLIKEERRNDIPNRWKNFKDWSVVTSDKVEICSDAWIGPNSIILKGVTIGEAAIVSAGSVVTKNVPPNTIVAGVPAKVIKEI